MKILEATRKEAGAALGTKKLQIKWREKGRAQKT